MTLKNSKNLKITPMMEQYNKIKKQYPDAFLFYRIGDFYELFYDDAVKGSQLLELTLTSRNKNSKNSVPMCGVPYHAVKNYIDILVSKGYKIAICEQMENPATAIGMVKREVVRLITPGTFMNDDANNAKSNNYLTSIYYKNNTYGFAYCDLSTGELKTTYLDNIKDLFNEIINLQTKETIVNKDISKDILNFLKKKNILISYSNIQKKMNSISEINFVTEHLNNEFEIKATSQLIFYLFSTQKRSLNHLQKAIEYKPSFFLKIDHNAKQNLELLSSLRTNSKKGSLLYLLDKTKTAMGGRLLKQWLDRPLLNVDEIKSRQRQVNILLKNFIERKQLQDYLIKVYDLERLAGKVSFGNANGRDLIRLKISLDQIPKIKEILSKINVHGVFDKICFNLDPINDVRNLIEKSIDSDVSLSLKDGNVIKSGYNKELDKYKDAIKNGRKWITKIENREREKTGIKKLKIGFNKVFGYYIEVTKSNLQQVPLDRYIRKQTLTNSERFITLELKNTEQLILEAHDKLISLEYQLFVNIRNYIQSYIDKLQKLSHTIAYLDVIQGFALVADVNHYVCPNITNNSHDINIINGRHPVVEKFLEADYIPNSIKMFNNTNILLITGPNMSGKSTYMRQLALIVIMAQIGSFVPADEATLPIFHQIFTRIGASDDLVSGESTFMVEMMEANNALQNANENSLIIFDEIGRGTSTYDGIALAQSIIEYIHNHVHAKTLFSTHYHELTMLSKNMSDLKNIHVGAIEKNGELIFSHKIMEGSADKSYGIHVAKLAGLPIELLDRAKYILKKLEDENDNNKNTLIQESLKLGFSEDFDNKKVINKEKIVSEEKIDKKINKVIDKLKKIDLLNTTPICAINILCELKKILDEDNDV